MVEGRKLTDPGQARMVRVDNGVAVPTDEPFAELKESLAGYWIVEADEDRAFEITAAAARSSRSPTRIGAGGTRTGPRRPRPCWPAPWAGTDRALPAAGRDRRAAQRGDGGGTLDADDRHTYRHRLEAVRAHLLEQIGDPAAARDAYLTAARLTANVPEQRYLQRRAAELR